MVTVLVVDDDQRLLDALAAVIEQDGYRVITAINGEEAMRRARMEHPVLVVTDYMMPVMNGGELVRALLADPQLSGVPVVMASAVVALPADLPVTASLRKPFPAAALMALVRQHAPQLH